MRENSYFRLQLIVFALVSTSFTNIYLTQPVLPVLQDEFSATIVQASLSVSAVILGITLANLPFGFLADRFSIHPLILIGGILVSAGGLVCAITHELWILIGGRFLQGLFIPSLTTCLAAYLSKTLPSEKLNVVMGSYVSATILGGLGGRLLGGWIHPPLHWRYAFFSASVLTILVTLLAVFGLPKQSLKKKQNINSTSFFELLKRWDLFRIFLCAAGCFAIFSSMFNYLPYRLAAPPLELNTEITTLFYLVYIIGIFIGPLAGRISNRFGSGKTLLGGSLVLGVALTMLFFPSILSIVFGLLGLCAGFFTIHAAAVGSLNRKLTSGQGRANALYVLFYYMGGWLGITGSGFIFRQGGWQLLISVCAILLLIPLGTAIGEFKENRHSKINIRYKDEK